MRPLWSPTLWLPLNALWPGLAQVIVRALLKALESRVPEGRHSPLLRTSGHERKPETASASLRGRGWAASPGIPGGKRLYTMLLFPMTLGSANKGKQGQV